MQSTLEERVVSRCLLSGGVPRNELHVHTNEGLVAWMPDGSVRALSVWDGWNSPGKVGFVSLIPR